MEDKQVTAIVVGAGSRGSTYSNYALDFPQKFKVISYLATSQLVIVNSSQVIRAQTVKSSLNAIIRYRLEISNVPDRPICN